MQAYTFTSAPISRALLAAKHRGIRVRVILDKSQFDCHHFSERYFLLKAHVPVWEDDVLNIAHNKVLIIDDRIVETGSFNFTHMAQYHNAENVLIVRDPQVAMLYEANWVRRQKRSRLIQYFTCLSHK